VRQYAARMSNRKKAKTGGAKTKATAKPTVAAWITANTTGWKTAVIKRLLAIGRRTLPAATQSIKWAQPVIEQGGPIAFIKVATGHVTFGFWRGAELDDPGGVLDGGDRMKHVKLASADAIDEARLAAWLAQAARLNAERGDQTRRG
jgi:hypothetical protein